MELKFLIRRLFNCSVFMIINTEIWSFVYTSILVILGLFSYSGYTYTGFSDTFMIINIIGVFLIYIGIFNKRHFFLTIAYCLILVASTYKLFDELLYYNNSLNYLFYFSNTTIYTRFVWKLITYDFNRENIGKYGQIRKSCLCGD